MKQHRLSRFAVVEGGRPSLSDLKFADQRPEKCPHVARRLTLARELAGKGVEDAAYLLGCSAAFLRGLERPDYGATFKELEAFGKHYGATVDWLLGQVPELVPESELTNGGGRASPRDKHRLRATLAMRKVANPPDHLARLKQRFDPNPNPNLTA